MGCALAFPNVEHEVLLGKTWSIIRAGMTLGLVDWCLSIHQLKTSKPLIDSEGKDLNSFYFLVIFLILCYRYENNTTIAHKNHVNLICMSRQNICFMFYKLIS